MAVARKKPEDDAAADMASHVRDATEFLKALTHETRLMILCALAEGEKSVGELEEMLQLRQPSVSQQLARLRLDGFVNTRREGRSIVYSLGNEDAKRVIMLLHEIFCDGKR